MKLSDILTEAKDDEFDVKVRVSGADLENIPDSLSYNINDVVFETKEGAVRIPDGGVVSLDIGPVKLAKTLAKATNMEAKEILNIQLTNPPSDFKLGSNKSPYSVTVEYVTEEGKRDSVELKFNAISFEPSGSAVSYLKKKL
jgi:hypothetical protein